MHNTVSLAVGVCSEIPYPGYLNILFPSQVLVEWCEGGDIGKTQREWLNMTNPELFKSVYVEKSLLWARRLLSSEQNRAVAWPARVSILLQVINNYPLFQHFLSLAIRFHPCNGTTPLIMMSVVF